MSLPSLEESAGKRYGVRLAVLYGTAWFIDLLDSSILNVALPSIAKAFHIEATQAEWTIIGFLLALAVAIPVSGWLGDRYGCKKIFLLSQVVYTLSSLACGLSANLDQLVFFRIIQGFAGGTLIPVGMTMLIRSVPAKKWAGLASKMNMVTLTAPAIGPVLAGYITTTLSWPWLFFIKLPLSLGCLFLSWIWLKESKLHSVGRFDWGGFILSGAGLSLFLYALSRVGEEGLSSEITFSLLGISLVIGGAFIYLESKQLHPMIQLSLFRNTIFSLGNIVQSAANMIFLGATFITGLYLQQGLKFDMVATGWMLAAITVGMFIVQPLVSKFYNRAGPLPFIIPGLILLSFSMFALCFLSPQTSPYLIAFIIFCEGAASSIVQTPNMLAIFGSVAPEQKASASSLYALFKQLSASLGVALSTMLVTIGLSSRHIPQLANAASDQVLPIFQFTFFILGLIPLLALICCLFINNRKVLSNIHSS